MESFTALLIPALLGILLVRLLALPIAWGFKVLLHGVGGFLCLWLLNTVSGFTGIYFPINAITVSVAGFLGIPGIGLMTLLGLAA